MSRRFFRGLAALALLLSGSALATVVVTLSIEEMAASVPLIVRGHIGQSQTRWDDAHRVISTFTEVVTAESFKGRAPSVFLVREPGGEVGQVGQFVSGAPSFKSGEEVVLFLTPAVDDPAVYQCFAMAAGKVTLEESPSGGRRAVRQLDGLAEYQRAKNGTPRVTAVGNESLGSADLFLSRVRAAVAKQVAP
jgi:hypothetical protein